MTPHRHVSLCGVLSVQFQKLHQITALSFLSVDPWSFSSGFWAFYTYQSHQKLTNTNTAFLIYKERDYCQADETLGGLARALILSRRVWEAILFQKRWPPPSMRQLDPSFLKGRRAYRVDHNTPSLTQSYLWLVFLHGDLLLGHCPRLLWLISTVYHRLFF